MYVSLDAIMWRTMAAPLSDTLPPAVIISLLPSDLCHAVVCHLMRYTSHSSENQEAHKAARSLNCAYWNNIATVIRHFTTGQLFFTKSLHRTDKLLCTNRSWGSCDSIMSGYTLADRSLFLSGYRDSSARLMGSDIHRVSYPGRIGECLSWDKEERTWR
jgi:hypothetical protein